MRWLLILGVAVALTGCARSTEDWVRQLKDEDVVKRRQALRELAARSTEAERLVGPLTEALRDANPYVRHDAALALAKLGAEARTAVPVLTVALRDRDRGVRAAAGKALKKIDLQAARQAGLR
jgi:HEAT repeat protein